MRSACIAWKSDKATSWRMPRANLNDHVENFDGKSKDEYEKRQNRWDRASQREEKSSSRARCRGCAWGTWGQRWWAGGGSTCRRIWRWHQRKPSTKRTAWETSTLGQVEEDSTIRARSSKCINIFRSIHYSGTSCEVWDTMSAGVRTCAEVMSCGRWRTHFCVGYFPREGWTWESLHRRSVVVVSRGEDARDLERSELNELVENWYTSQRSWGGKFGKLRWNFGKVISRSWWRRKVGQLGKVIRRSWWMKNWFITSWRMKKVQKIVMDEEMVQNGVMDEELIQELCDGCQNWPEGCDGSVRIQNWWMEHSTIQQSKIVGRMY